jgi:rRNA maturation protein Nop10
MGLTRITLDAKPDEIGRENLLPHPQKYHADDSPWIKHRINVRNRATGSAKTASKTLLDILPSWLSSNVVFESGIQFIQDYRHLFPPCRFSPVIAFFGEKQFTSQESR